MSKQLIIIPGLGDMHWVYRVGVAVFRLRGYHTHVYVVGWDDSEEQYPQKLEELKKLLDSYDEPVNLLGISAGGVMAINALAASEHHVAKVVTVCSPYRYRYDHEGEMIAGALKDLVGVLPTLKKRFGDITSLHAEYDRRVQVHDSQPIGITHHVLPSLFHRPTIFMALTFMSGTVVRYLKKRKSEV